MQECKISHSLTYFRIGGRAAGIGEAHGFVFLRFQGSHPLAQSVTAPHTLTGIPIPPHTEIKTDDDVIFRRFVPQGGHPRVQPLHGEELGEGAARPRQGRAAVPQLLAGGDGEGESAERGEGGAAGKRRVVFFRRRGAAGRKDVPVCT